MAEADTAPMDVDQQETNEDSHEAPLTAKKKEKTAQQDKSGKTPSFFDSTPVEGKRQRKTVEMFKPEEFKKKTDSGKPQEVRKRVPRCPCCPSIFDHNGL